MAVVESGCGVVRTRAMGCGGFEVDHEGVPGSKGNASRGPELGNAVFRSWYCKRTMSMGANSLWSWEYYKDDKIRWRLSL